MMVRLSIVGSEGDPLTDTTGRQVDRKARLQIPPQSFPKQDPQVRITNWKEAYLPIDLESAKIEATRCIQCPAAPCQKACPVHNDIPGAFWKLEQGDIMGAAEVFHESSNLPEMCGRLCPQERLCEGDCVVGKKALPVAIGRLEAYVGDHYRHNGGYDVTAPSAPTGRRAAIVGAGPAGLAAAEVLARLGHQVTIFDAWPEPGGVLLYGIPNFKMEKEVLDTKLAQLRKLGIEFVANTYVGKDVTIDELFGRGYEAIFLGQGASLGNQLDVPGSELAGVLIATDFLVRGNLHGEQLPESMREPLAVGDNVVVIGGGDTSMDCVRTAVRLGAKEVTCVYRRTEAEQLGRAEERVHAREEGVRFEYLAAPLTMDAGPDGRVARVHFERMALGEPDESGRRRPVPTGDQFAVEASTVVVAIGYHADEDLVEREGLAHARDLVTVDPETFETSRPGVFAGGDCVNGADLVVTAIADARRAAAAIHKYLLDKVGVAA
jgi:glutamate synthase (NADPH/NADH) small chain